MAILTWGQKILIAKVLMSCLLLGILDIASSVNVTYGLSGGIRDFVEDWCCEPLVIPDAADPWCVPAGTWKDYFSTSHCGPLRDILSEGNFTLNPEIILGDPIYTLNNLTGLGTSIIDLDPLTIKNAYIANGTLAGIGNVSELVIGTSTEKSGSVYRELEGFIWNEKGKATYAGTLVISQSDKGGLVGRGFNFYNSDTNSTFGFLDGMVGLTIQRLADNGTFSGEVYEWK